MARGGEWWGQVFPVPQVCTTHQNGPNRSFFSPPHLLPTSIPPLSNTQRTHVPTSNISVTPVYVHIRRQCCMSSLSPTVLAENSIIISKCALKKYCTGPIQKSCYDIPLQMVQQSHLLESSDLDSHVFLHYLLASGLGQVASTLGLGFPICKMGLKSTSIVV